MDNAQSSMNNEYEIKIEEILIAKQTKMLSFKDFN